MRILFILLAIGVILLILRFFSRASPQVARKLLINTGVAAVVLLILFLLMTGRLHWIFALAVAAIPFIRRAMTLLQYAPWLKRLYRRYSSSGTGAGNANSHTSQVGSQFLRMRLNQESGEIEGKVLKGQFQGSDLADLTLLQLLELHAEISVDADSTALLQAYMDRIHPNWRSPGHSAGGSDQTDAPGARPTSMSSTEAWEILGLDNKATRDDIIAAHRRLMQRLHPDHGGSTYLAAKINLAKDYLLKTR